MKTSEFFELLEANKEKALRFEYAPGLLVEANYHITEVKHVKLDAVDCGTGTAKWNETLIQLWENPNEKEKEKPLSVYKAISILKKVGKIKAYDLDAEVKFEYGNASFHTAQLYINTFELENELLLLKLAVEPTDCKAKDACGIPESAGVEENASASCAPGSGCC